MAIERRVESVWDMGDYEVVRRCPNDSNDVETNIDIELILPNVGISRPKNVFLLGASNGGFRMTEKFVFTCFDFNKDYGFTIHHDQVDFTAFCPVPVFHQNHIHFTRQVFQRGLFSPQACLIRFLHTKFPMNDLL